MSHFGRSNSFFFQFLNYYFGLSLLFWQEHRVWFRAIICWYSGFVVGEITAKTNSTSSILLGRQRLIPLQHPACSHLYRTVFWGYIVPATVLNVLFLGRISLRSKLRGCGVLQVNLSTLALCSIQGSTFRFVHMMGMITIEIKQHPIAENLIISEINTNYHRDFGVWTLIWANFRPYGQSQPASLISTGQGVKRGKTI